AMRLNAGSLATNPARSMCESLIMSASSSPPVTAAPCRPPLTTVADRAGAGQARRRAVDIPGRAAAAVDETGPGASLGAIIRARRPESGARSRARRWEDAAWPTVPWWRRRSGGDQLGWLGDDVHQGPVAHDRDGERLADRIGEHQPLQVLCLLDGLASRGQQEVTGPQAGPVGRAAGDDLAHPQAGLAAEPLLQRHGQRA